MQNYEISAIQDIGLGTYTRNRPAPAVPRVAQPASALSSRNGAAQDTPGEEATVVSLSPEARQTTSTPLPSGAPESEGATESSSDEDELSTEENRQVTQLKARDREVRAHEQAHRSAGGQYAGAAQFGYETGPDGKRYAVSGEVSIDMSPVGDDPEATAQKMQVVKRAAMAPAQPSGADRSVYARASRMEATARAEARQQDRAERTSENDSGSFSPTENSAEPKTAAAASGSMAV